MARRLLLFQFNAQQVTDIQHCPIGLAEVDVDVGSSEPSSFSSAIFGAMYELFSLPRQHSLLEPTTEDVRQSSCFLCVPGVKVHV